MTENMTEKLVNNALLTLTGRIGMVLVTLLLPMLIGWLVAQADDLDKLAVRTTVIEERLSSAGVRTDNSVGNLSTQVEELRRQNILILQAIARLEARMERVSSSPTATRQ